MYLLRMYLLEKKGTTSTFSLVSAITNIYILSIFVFSAFASSSYKSFQDCHNMSRMVF